MERKPVSRVKKGCKRCGSTDVAWHQSERGKWYLIEVFTDPRDGGAVASYRDFHSTYCGKPELHNQEQEHITVSFQMDEAERNSERERKARAAEDARIEREAQMMRDFIALGSRHQRDVFINGLREHYANEARNPVSMDYMTEHMRYCAMMEELRSEIEFYEDLLHDLDEEV